jgi:putative tryptophan/tyrosine transport system substrate-binding protein
VKRRGFITLLGGAAVAWPLAARAQQPNQMRRIGVLIPFSETDSETQALLAAFKQRFQELRWTDAATLRSSIDTRMEIRNEPAPLPKSW